MLLRDSVVIISEKGDKLETSSLTWDEANKKISTKKFIRLIVGESKDTLYGTGFTANSDFTNFAISTFSGRRKYANLSMGVNYSIATFCSVGKWVRVHNRKWKALHTYIMKI